MIFFSTFRRVDFLLDFYAVQIKCWWAIKFYKVLGEQEIRVCFAPLKIYLFKHEINVPSGEIKPVSSTSQSHSYTTDLPISL